MRVMVIMKASKDSEAGAMPSEKLLTEMGQYNEQLVQAGIMQAAEGLHPSANGVRIHFSHGQQKTLSGPFPATTELVAGFWLWQVHSMEEAIDWVKRCPVPTNQETEIEIRQIFAPEDFGPEFTPELRAQEDRLRAEVEQRNQSHKS